MSLKRLFALVLTGLATVHAGAAPVPVPGRTDQVYDDVRGLLYMPTNTGSVLRYNPATGTFLTPFSVGVNLTAADTTPDGKYLLATEATAGVSQGVVRRVDLDTGAVTNFFYDLAGGGTGGFDIVALNDGRAVFTSAASGSGFAPAMRSLDLATGAVTQFTVKGQPQFMNQHSELWRSRDRTTFLTNDGNTSGGGLRIYSTNTQDYLVNTGLGTHLNGFRVAFNSDGTHVAMHGFNVSAAAQRSRDLSLLNIFPDFFGGVAYDPTGSVLYAGVLTDGAIQMYRTSDYTRIGSIPLAGADIGPRAVPGNGLTVSGDGEWLFLTSNGNLYTYDIQPVPEPATAALFAAGALVLLRRRRR